MAEPVQIDESWYFKPAGIPTRRAAGGVVARLIDAQWHIALAHEAEYDDYVLPKGGIDKGETPEQAAIREIEEEAGVTGLRCLGLLGTCERLNFARTKWVATDYFLFITEDVGGKPTDTRKHSQPAAWFPLDKLPENMFWPEQKRLLVERQTLVRILLGI